MEGFRAAARDWLADNAASAPPDYGAIMPPELRAEATAWQRRIHDAGFAGIDWPVGFGGRGLTAEHRAVWTEECALAGVPPVLNMVGLVLAAGAVLGFGTDEQRRRHLPPTARGDVVWCQLFSEPDAGSDLAALRTAAVADGDAFVVTGHKVWSSAAHCSDWGILLARTDPTAPRHRGISCLLVDMTAPGVEIRPLRQMTGAAHFDEVVLDEARVPAANLIGPLHGGWGVAMATLTNERGFIGASAIAFGRRLDALAAAAGGAGASRRDAVLRLVAQGRALRHLGRRQGPAATVAASLLKLGLAEMSLATASTAAGLAGPAAVLEGAAAAAVVAAPGARLGGGTSEIQRTLIGERLLGLPAEPRPGRP